MMQMMMMSAALCLVACALAAPFSSELDGHWATFKLQYGKNYSASEEVWRRATWEHTVQRVQQHNLEADMGLRTFHMGVNQHADLREEEIKNLLGYKQSAARRPGASFLAPEHVEIPDELDWREHGAVTPVKNQGACGSCWAFSTTGSLEGQHWRQTGKLVSLSEQNLVDCSGNWGNNGCNGGLMDLAFQYIKDNKGVDTESSYPYTARDDTCKFKAATVGATDAGYVDVAPSGDEDMLLKALATVGPISIAIDASQPSFHYYEHGVYRDVDCSSESLDHGVLLVGYGTENGQDYWLVKNSWGPGWGDQGYIKIARNYHNMCGVATQASYPLV